MQEVILNYYTLKEFEMQKEDQSRLVQRDIDN